MVGTKLSSSTVAIVIAASSFLQLHIYITVFAAAVLVAPLPVACVLTRS